VVVLGRGFESVEHDFGRGVGHIIAVAVGNEEEPRQGDQPQAAQADLDARELLHVVAEDAALVGTAVAVAVGQDEHAVTERQIEPQRPVGIGVVFG
jgi:hypothetical protein